MIRKLMGNFFAAALGLLLIGAAGSQAGELHKAAMTGDMEKARTLLSQGANVNEVDQFKETPLYKALAYGKYDVALLLINKGADVNFLGGVLDIPLIKLAVYGNAEVVRALLDKGVNVNTRDTNSSTPLHSASSKEIAELLVARGADINAVDNLGNKPLHGAADRSKTEVAAFLISKGANVNDRGDYQNTPLHWAALRGNVELTKLLVESGAEVNAGNSNGDTPLHKASTADVAQLLIQKGADLNATNNAQQTPAVATEKSNYPEVAAMLRKLGGSDSPRQELNNLIARLSKEYGYVYRDDVESALRFVRAINPPPQISQEARDEMTKGKTAFKMATDPKGLQEAVEHFKKASKLAPWWADSFFNLALTLEKQREFYQAKENLSLYLIAAPDAQDAQAVKEKIAEMDYREQRKRQSEDATRRSADLYNSGDKNGAIREAKDAIRIDPDNPYAYSTLGSSYAALDRYLEAIPMLKEAIQLGDRRHFVYQSLARSYNNLDQRNKAIEILEEVLAFDSWSDGVGFTHGKLGFYYERDGQTAKALEHYEKALSYAGSDPDVDRKHTEERITALKQQLGK